MSLPLKIKALKRSQKKTKWPKVDLEKKPKLSKLYDPETKAVLFNSNGAPPWSILSNFSAAPFIARDLISNTLRMWCTVEHWYQFHKLALVDSNEKNFNDILTTYNPSVAKFKASKKNNAEMIDGWDEGLKDQIMLIGCRHKASQSMVVYETLKESGTRNLIENAYWDEYWGSGRHGEGKNMLGYTYMVIRNEIITGKLKLKSQSQIMKLVQKLKVNHE